MPLQHNFKNADMSERVEKSFSPRHYKSVIVVMDRQENRGGVLASMCVHVVTDGLDSEKQAVTAGVTVLLLQRGPHVGA